MDGRTVYKFFTTVGFLAAGALALGCGSKAKPAETTPQAQADDKKNQPLKAEITPAKPGDVVPPADSIYFDYDSYQIAAPSKAVLDNVAGYLGKNPGATVTISGHTDARGTTEYNLMLGDQRAKAAHDYLVRSGIDPIRIKTISFGEERPAVPGESEDSWSKNRRDEFQTTTK
jgi:peptidoglycan-associated lipoprotein